MKILINASNIRGGGAVQVATSFLCELVDLGVAKKYDVLLSPIVFDNLMGLNYDLKSFKSIIVESNYGFKYIFSTRQFKLINFDLVFTIFGPLYTLIKPRISLVGFAQPNIIYPDVGISFFSNVFDKFVFSIKFCVQKLFFYRSDALIVELNHVRDRLLKLFLFNNHKIFVIPNAASSFYINLELKNSTPGTGKFKIGLLSKYYHHKNFQILPQVADVMIEKYGFSDFEFHLTIDHKDFLSLGFSKFSFFVNHGPLRVDECLKFYNEVDCIFFPSLLECFSASPLEALIMKKLLLASDRDFVRDVAGEYALYFDPLSPESAAESLYAALNSRRDEVYFASARSHAISFSSALKRAESYCDLINNFTEK